MIENYVGELAWWHTFSGWVACKVTGVQERDEVVFEITATKNKVYKKGEVFWDFSHSVVPRKKLHVTKYGRYWTNPYKWVNKEDN